ncbi:MAG: hypothetical protein AB7T74_14840 [Clostridia bacterium]
MVPPSDTGGLSHGSCTLLSPFTFSVRLEGAPREYRICPLRVAAEVVFADTMMDGPVAVSMEVYQVLKAKATRNHAGVVIRGTGADLEELYCALNTLMEKRDGLVDGEIPQSGTNLRIFSLCNDIRHALPVSTTTETEGFDDPGAMKGPVVDAGRILSFKTGKELPFDQSLDGVESGDDGLEELEELEEFDGIEDFDEDYIDAGELDDAYDDAEEPEAMEELDEPGTMGNSTAGDLAGTLGPGFRFVPGEKTGLPLQAVCEFRIMWPDVIFVSLLLREYLGSRYDLAYGKKLKGLDWTLDWVAARRFQIVVLDCLCLHVSPAQARSIRKLFMESYSNLVGYCTQYVDKLSYTFAWKNVEQRLKMLPQLPRKIVAQGNDYRAMEAEIRLTARDYGCPTWELGLTEELPSDFEW